MMDQNVLDRVDEIKKIDKGDMLKSVYEFPDMLERSAAFAKTVDIKLPEDPTGIVFSGMGGSAIGGDIVRTVYEPQVDIPMIVNRNYSLPKFVDKSFVHIAISYSGNTEETLLCLKDAEARGLKIIALTSGGKLYDIASEKGYPVITLPKGVQPRAALPAIMGSLLVALDKIGVISEVVSEVNEAVKFLKRAREEHMKERRLSEVKQLALRLFGKTPLIYASSGITEGAAMRCVTQLNENGKTLAHMALFSELNHNEIVAVSHLVRAEHNFSLVILRDEEDSERIKKRIEITKSLIGPKVGGSFEITSAGGGRLTRALSLILYGDFLSVYHAILKGVDPTEVEVIEKLKKELVR